MEGDKANLEAENRKLKQLLQGLEGGSHELPQELAKTDQQFNLSPMLEHDNRRLQQQLKDLEANNKFLQDEIKRLTDLVGKKPEPTKPGLEEENQRLQRTIKNLETTIELLQEEIQRLNSQPQPSQEGERTGRHDGRLEIENRKLQQQLKDADENIHILKEEVDRMRDLIDRGDGIRKPDNNRELERVLRELQAEKKANEDKDTNLTLLRIEITRLGGELDALRKELGDKKRELDQKNRELDAKKRESYTPKTTYPLPDEETKKLTAANRDLENKVRDLQKEVGDLKRQLDQKNRELDQKNRELDAKKRESYTPKTTYPLADEETKKLAAANRDLENKVRELQREVGDKTREIGDLRRQLDDKNRQVGDKYRQPSVDPKKYAELEQAKKNLEDEIKALQAQAKPSEPLPVDYERIRNLEAKVGAYDDICHYYRRRIDAYEKAFQQNNINPLLIKLIADAQDKPQQPQQKDLSNPHNLQVALVQQNKELEKLLAEREGEAQAFKKKVADLENLLYRSDITKEPNWAVRKECAKLKEQVIYQQQRIDQLIDMLLHHDIDIVTGHQKSRAPSEIGDDVRKKPQHPEQLKKKSKSDSDSSSDSDAVHEEEEYFEGGRPQVHKDKHPKKRRENVKSSARDEDDVPTERNNLHLSQPLMTNYYLLSQQ